MRTLPVKLKPADVLHVREMDLPIFPAWFPLDPAPTEDEPNPRPWTEEERRTIREQRRVAQAVEGPYDGHRGDVTFRDHPPHEVVLAGGAVVYVLDRDASTTKGLVYRYSTRSPAHPGLMAAVTEAVHEAGRPYLEEARDGSRPSDD